MIEIVDGSLSRTLLAIELVADVVDSINSVVVVVFNKGSPSLIATDVVANVNTSKND